MEIPLKPPENALLFRNKKTSFTLLEAQKQGIVAKQPFQVPNTTKSHLLSVFSNLYPNQLALCTEAEISMNAFRIEFYTTLLNRNLDCINCFSGTVDHKTESTSLSSLPPHMLS